jgi:hypothetical protein
MMRLAGAGRVFDRTFEAHVFPAAEAWQRILEPPGCWGRST